MKLSKKTKDEFYYSNMPSVYIKAEEGVLVPKNKININLDFTHNTFDDHLLFVHLDWSTIFVNQKDRSKKNRERGIHRTNQFIYKFIEGSTAVKVYNDVKQFFKNPSIEVASEEFFEFDFQQKLSGNAEHTFFFFKNPGCDPYRSQSYEFLEREFGLQKAHEMIIADYSSTENPSNEIIKERIPVKKNNIEISKNNEFVQISSDVIEAYKQTLQYQMDMAEDDCYRRMYYERSCQESCGECFYCNHADSLDGGGR